MQLISFPPGTTASGLIDGLAVMRTTCGITRTLVAEGRVSIGIRIAGAAHLWRADGWHRLPDHTLSGVHCHSRTVRTGPESVLVLAHLHPAAASALGFEAATLVGRSMDLATLWPRAELHALARRIAQCDGDAARAACLGQHVDERLRHRAPPPAVVEAVNRIRAAKGEVRIEELARALGLSVDTLERRFTACIGTSPKRFARAVRLRSAVLAYSAGVTLTEVAVGAGYYDQSHFVREMRVATGEAPGRVLVAREYC